MALGWREKRREGAMTHRVGVLVGRELHQRRAVHPLLRSGGVLAWTTLAFVRLHAAAVLPPARTAAKRDVLLVAVSCGRRGSAVAGKMVRKWKTCLSSHRRTVFISLVEMLFWSAGGEVIPHISFSSTFPPQLMSCLLSMLILFTIYSPLFLLTFLLSLGYGDTLIHTSLISVASSNLHQHGLTAFSGDYSCYDCIGRQGCHTRKEPCGVYCNQNTERKTHHCDETMRSSLKTKIYLNILLLKMGRCWNLNCPEVQNPKDWKKKIWMYVILFYSMEHLCKNVLTIETI